MKITQYGFAIIEGDSHLGKWAEESGRLDHDQNALPQVLPFISKGDTVIDIGGNIGTHTIAYANKVGPEGKVISFEPYNPAFECLDYNMKNFMQVTCVNQALGKQKGTAKISCDNANFGMATISEKGQKVVVDTIDSFFNEFDKIDFIKIDAEGYEIDILEGGKATIQKLKPIMFIEINSHTLALKNYTTNELLNKITSLGYTYRNIYEEQGFEDDQFDVLCFPL